MKIRINREFASNAILTFVLEFTTLYEDVLT